MRREPQGPNWRPAPPRTRWRPPVPQSPFFGFPAFWLGSIAAHLLLVALFFLWPDPRSNPLPPAAPPSFDIVFEGGQPERPVAEPVEGIETPPSPPSPPNQAEIPPPPNAPPQPSQPALPPIQQALPLPPPPAPVPPAPVPLAPVPPAPIPPAPVPPPPVPPPVPLVQQALPAQPPLIPQPPRPEPPATAQAPLPPLPGTVEIFAPPTELRLPERLPERLPVRLAETLPLPPPPTPTPPPRQPTPQQQQPQRPQQAQPSLPGIWVPGGVQLSRPATPPAGRPQARGTDTTVDPRFLEGRPRTDPSVRVTGAQVGADWRAAFRRWLDENLSYPQRAIALGEDGTVRVQVLANPDGTVRSVRLVGPSTSPSLNFGTTFPFNGARLPAFPAGSDPNGVTVDLTVNYILMRR